MNGTSQDCGNCKFFRRGRVGQSLGVCRSRAPVPLMVGMTKDAMGNGVPVINTYWPQVPDTELCGDWSRKVDLGAIDLTKLELEDAATEGSA